MSGAIENYRIDIYVMQKLTDNRRSRFSVSVLVGLRALLLPVPRLGSTGPGTDRPDPSAGQQAS